MDPSALRGKLIHRGAEADLYLSHIENWHAVIKRRVKKSYRTEQLDKQIRLERTTREGRLLNEAKRAGVRVPTVFDVDLEGFSITMSYISGRLVRDGLDALDASMRSRIFREVGSQVGLLHSNGLVHGDLTTSNILIDEGHKPVLLDFGMSHRSLEPEDMGVDVHLLQRSIATSHRTDQASCVKEFAKGYRATAGQRRAKLSFRKAAEIARRGRYFALR